MSLRPEKPVIETALTITLAWFVAIVAIVAAFHNFRWRDH